MIEWKTFIWIKKNTQSNKLTLYFPIENESVNAMNVFNVVAYLSDCVIFCTFSCDWNSIVALPKVVTGNCNLVHGELCLPHIWFIIIIIIITINIECDLFGGKNWEWNDINGPKFEHSSHYNQRILGIVFPKERSFFGLSFCLFLFCFAISRIAFFYS